MWTVLYCTVMFFFRPKTQDMTGPRPRSNSLPLLAFFDCCCTVSLSPSIRRPVRQDPNSVSRLPFFPFLSYFTGYILNTNCSWCVKNKKSFQLVTFVCLFQLFKDKVESRPCKHKKKKRMMERSDYVDCCCDDEGDPSHFFSHHSKGCVVVVLLLFDLK